MWGWGEEWLERDLEGGWGSYEGEEHLDRLS